MAKKKETPAVEPVVAPAVEPEVPAVEPEVAPVSDPDQLQLPIAEVLNSGNLIIRY